MLLKDHWHTKQISLGCWGPLVEVCEKSHARFVGLGRFETSPALVADGGHLKPGLSIGVWGLQADPLC